MSRVKTVGEFHLKIAIRVALSEHDFAVISKRPSLTALEIIPDSDDHCSPVRVLQKVQN